MTAAASADLAGLAGRRRPLVLGLGNVLYGDDGVGVAVVQALADGRAAGRLALPEDVDVVDGGTLGLELLPWLQDASRVVLIDAIDRRRPGGDVEVLSGAALTTSLGGWLSPHEVGLADLLAAARLSGADPDFTAIVAIQPEAIEPGIRLSDAVAAAVPVAADAACQALAGPPG